MRSKNWLLISILCLVVSCGPKSSDDYKKEGQRIVKELILELKKVKTREDLVKASSRLQRDFQDLVSIIIEARTVKEAQFYTESSEDQSLEDQYYSDVLREELNRIYQMDGAYEVIEKCQAPALEALDLFEKKRRRE